MVKFIFDLDGTLTKAETLPIISAHFSLQEQMALLTAKTVQGNIPFVESFIRRVNILSKYSVDEISLLLEQIDLHEKVCSFIQNNSKYCAIATGNLDCWVERLVAKIGCEAFCSSAIIEDNKVAKLSTILKKENIVKRYKAEGFKVVFIGDGNNDVEAMRLADVAIATGLVHSPATSVLSVADYAVYSEEALCRLLYQLL